MVIANGEQFVRSLVRPMMMMMMMMRVMRH